MYITTPSTATQANYRILKLIEQLVSVVSKGTALGLNDLASVIFNACGTVGGESTNSGDGAGLGGGESTNSGDEADLGGGESTNSGDGADSGDGESTNSGDEADLGGGESTNSGDGADFRPLKTHPSPFWNLSFPSYNPLHTFISRLDNPA